MIILPDKNLAWQRSKILMPVVDREWRTPSWGLPKNVYGHENQTRWRLTARLHDGYIAWRGWFDDRADADAFLFAMATGSLQYERELWRLPTPHWRPDIGEELSYEFVTTRAIVSTSASNQTEATPADWNNAANSIETLASGGSGGAFGNSNTINATGGCGAGYSKSINVTLSGTITFHLEAGAPGQLNLAGVLGGDCWYNGATLAGSSVGSKGGPAGTTGVTITAKPIGGDATAGIGNFVKKSGGGSGSVGGTGASITGGGGAAGPTGDGVASANAGASAATAGGNADLGGTGAGVGSPGTTGGANSTNGGAGTEWDATHGSGGGSGGVRGGAQNAISGNGGLYGSGSGGAQGRAALTATSGSGGPAIIWIIYTPKPASGFNMPMLGM